ncbi:MAG TPA: copper transporter [Dermatophilaceae bacterium]|nr:copper transporter [Dermatophilaceae bacterium]
MIDFRYHLVSIVSIFLALAVGIVLGAGPLKEDLGNTLTEQVAQLRQDRNNLRSQLSAQQRETEARDSFVTAVSPRLTRDALAGRTVAILVQPGAAAGLVQQVSDALTGAGARVGATVTLADAWSDPAKRTLRAGLATELAPLVDAATGTASTDQLVSTVLARSILRATDQSTTRVDQGARQALEGLVAADLLTVTPDDHALSSAAVLVGAPVAGADPEVVTARLTSYVQLAAALDAAGSGTVVTAAADDTDPAASVGPVAAVRADPNAGKVVSTVDDANLPMGLTTLVLALTREYDGVAGRYGLAKDAAAVTPDVAATTRR